MTDEYFILTLQLALENEQLKRKITQLEIEVESLEKELRKPERMTSSENRAYWGIFGQILHFFAICLLTKEEENGIMAAGARSGAPVFCQDGRLTNFCA